MLLRESQPRSFSPLLAGLGLTCYPGHYSRACPDPSKQTAATGGAGASTPAPGAPPGWSRYVPQNTDLLWVPYSGGGWVPIGPVAEASALTHQPTPPAWVDESGRITARSVEAAREIVGYTPAAPASAPSARPAATASPPAVTIGPGVFIDEPYRTVTGDGGAAAPPPPQGAPPAEPSGITEFIGSVLPADDWIAGIPNWGLLAAAGAAAWMFFRK